MAIIYKCDKCKEEIRRWPIANSDLPRTWRYGADGGSYEVVASVKHIIQPDGDGVPAHRYDEDVDLCEICFRSLFRVDEQVEEVSA